MNILLPKCIKNAPSIVLVKDQCAPQIPPTLILNYQWSLLCGFKHKNPYKYNILLEIYLF